jgi:ADP-ribosylglycohydrolase
MSLTPGQRDRVSGVLVGQAVGDALGVPYEFAPPFTGDAQMLGGGLGDYAPGEYSDDTQMAVCIAQVSATGADLTTSDALDAIADWFLKWLHGGATDVGSQTREVLGHQQSGPGSGARIRAAADLLHERTGRTAGNGAIMRTAIVGLTRLHDRDATARSAEAVAAFTHPDPLATDSCILWTEAVRVAVLDGRFDLVSGLDLIASERRDQWATWIDDATGANPASFPNNAFTVTALQAAWAAISSTPGFNDEPPNGAAHLPAALHAAVHAGNDTDTVAAIAGGLLGARWGLRAIPQEWRDEVHGWPNLRAPDLVDLAMNTAVRGLEQPHE